jgi:hypothetical protein
MDNEEKLLNDVEEFKKQFPNCPDPNQYPQQAKYFIRLFYFYKNRKKDINKDLIIT